MIENVFFTEAMITDAFGAVAKCQVGIFRICFSADAALMAIALRLLLALLCLLLPGGLAKLCGLTGGLVMDSVCLPLEVRREVNEEVQQGNHRKQSVIISAGKQFDQKGEDKQDGFQPCDPLNFDWNKDKQDLRIRIQHGKGKKQRLADIRNTGQRIADPGEQGINNGEQERQKNTGGNIDCKAPCAPFPFQGISDHVIKIQRDQKEERIAGFRDKKEADNTENFSF